jgi:hypothetical protein
MKASMEDEMIMAMEAESAIKLEQMHKEMSEQQRIEELQKTVELRRMQFQSHEALRVQNADVEERRVKVQARLAHAEALYAATMEANITKELETRLLIMTASCPSKCWVQVKRISVKLRKLGILRFKF